MPNGRPLAPLSVTAEEHSQLVAWSKRPKTAQALAMRSASSYWLPKDAATLRSLDRSL
jgi:hypothetical protein